MIYVPYPCELTYYTLLLSNDALSLCCAFICAESEVDDVNFSITPLIQEWAYIVTNKEFRTLGFYINDSIAGYLLFPDGVTFISRYRWGYSYMSNITHLYIHKSIISYLASCLTFLLYHNLQLIYYHFAELLWLFAHRILYS